MNTHAFSFCMAKTHVKNVCIFLSQIMATPIVGPNTHPLGDKVGFKTAFCISNFFLGHAALHPALKPRFATKSLQMSQWCQHTLSRWARQWRNTKKFCTFVSLQFLENRSYSKMNLGRNDNQSWRLLCSGLKLPIVPNKVPNAVGSSSSPKASLVLQPRLCTWQLSILFLFSFQTPLL